MRIGRAGLELFPGRIRKIHGLSSRSPATGRLQEQVCDLERGQVLFLDWEKREAWWRVSCQAVQPWPGLL